MPYRRHWREEVLYVDWLRVARVLRLNPKQTAYFIAVRLHEIDPDELNLTRKERETLRRGIEQKIKNCDVERLVSCFQWLDPIDLKKFPKQPGLDTSARRSFIKMRALVEPEQPLSANEVKALRRQILRIVETESAPDRAQLIRELRELQYQNAPAGHVLRKLRESAPQCIEEFRQWLLDEIDRLRKLSPETERRPKKENGREVEDLYSEQRSISERILEATYWIQNIDRLVFGCVNEEDARKRIEEAKAGLPELKLQYLGTDYHYAPVWEVVRRAPAVSK
jgi:hypothetical protein